MGEVSETLILLRSLPLFAGFGDAELTRLSEHFIEVSYRKGDLVCDAGEPADRFFVVASGELEIHESGREGRVIHRVGPGGTFGEVSLLLGEGRSAAVTAARPARLLTLHERYFKRYMLRNARALENLSRALCQRLAAATRGDVVGRRTTAVGVAAAPGLRGRSLVASALSALLREIGEVPVLRVSLDAAASPVAASRPLLSKLAAESADRVAEHLSVRPGEPASLDLAVAADAPEVSGALTSLVEKVSDRFSYVVLDLGSSVASASEACDVLVQIVRERPPPQGDADARVRVLQVLNLFNPYTDRVPLNHCEPFVLPRDPALEGRDSRQQAEHLLEHPDSVAGPVLRRLAHKVLGRSTGLALGGGAAFGLCQVGVLQVLAAEGIAVDLVAGTSMGSVIALAFAAGVTPAEMRQMLGHGLNLRTILSAIDLTLTRPALLGGTRFTRIFRPLLGGAQSFDDLVRPCRAVATDVQTGERVTIGSGSLEEAFRASASVPLVWPPVMRDGRVLIDGSMSDPVPAEVVHDMGADVCIAINAIPRPEKGLENVLTRITRGLNLLNPLSYLGDGRNMPNMIDIGLNSIQTLSSELGNFKGIVADVRINPDLSGFTWADFDRPLELIDRGAEAAQRALPEIRAVFEQRRAAKRPASVAP